MRAATVAALSWARARRRASSATMSRGCFRPFAEVRRDRRERLVMPEAVGKLRRSIYAQKILLDFVNLKINNARQRYREEAIEKTILRILASCVFSHSLAPMRTSGHPRWPDSAARSGWRLPNWAGCP